MKFDVDICTLNTYIMKYSLTGILLCIIMIPNSSFGQKAASGLIDYDVTMQRRGGSNQKHSSSPSFSTKRQLIFNSTAGKFINQNSRRKRSGTQFINFQDKTLLHTFRKRNNDTTFYVSRPFEEAKLLTLTGKTKDLLGYECQEATVSFGNHKTTIWFTRDIPLSFSPVNRFFLPDGGVILELQNPRVHYLATKVQLKDIDDKAVTLPEPAQQLSREKLTKRRPRGRRNNRNR